MPDERLAESLSACPGSVDTDARFFLQLHVAALTEASAAAETLRSVSEPAATQAERRPKRGS